MQDVANPLAKRVAGNIFLFMAPPTMSDVVPQTVFKGKK